MTSSSTPDGSLPSPFRKLWAAGALGAAAALVELRAGGFEALLDDVDLVLRLSTGGEESVDSSGAWDSGDVKAAPEPPTVRNLNQMS